MEAYRSGEIRDRGEYKPTMRVRITKGSGWYRGMEGTEHEVCERTDHYDLLEDVGDSVVRFIRKDNCEIVDTPQQTYRGAQVRFYKSNRLVYSDLFYIHDGFDRVEVEKAQPRIEKPNYDHAFSVKDGRMVVDWDALEVTKENALEISIASWKWAYQWMQDNGEKLKKGGDECALCEVYGVCQGCPVARAASTDCRGTPFWTYSSATTLHEALDACRDEIAFLEGLR
jgi:hypothetical protein